MHRFIESVAAVAMIGGLTGCSDSTASREAAVVISPLELARSLADNRDATLAQYCDQMLELSGTIAEKVEPGGLNPTIGIVFEGIDSRLAFDANLSFVTFDPEDGAARSEFDDLAVGDAVTLRCRLNIINESGSLFLVDDCRVV